MDKIIDAERFKKFVIDNKLVSNAAGWIVAVSSTVLIQSTVGDVLLPTIYFCIVFLMHKIGFPYEEKSGYLSIFEKVNKINISNFLKEFISFAIMLTILYYIITFVINNLIDEKGNYKQQSPNQISPTVSPNQISPTPTVSTTSPTTDPMPNPGLSPMPNPMPNKPMEIVTLQAVNNFSSYGTGK